MEISTTRSKRSLLIGLIWFSIWYLGARIIDNPILLPGPVEVLESLLTMGQERSFWLSIFNSIFKIGLGFILGIVLGVSLGILAFRSEFFRDFIRPLLNLINSTPVAAIIVLLLIWFTSKELPILIVLLIVFPNIYYSTLKGLNSVDKKLLEMSKIFEVKKWKLYSYVYFEELKKYLMPSILVSSGLSWKSGVSGEVLGLVKNSIGENIYYSKLYLDTRELFAWTLVIILLSKGFFKLLEKLIKR